MIRFAFVSVALFVTTGCNSSSAGRSPIHAATASTTPLAMAPGSAFRNALSSFADAHDLELTVTQEIVFSEGADANVLLRERRSGCRQFDIVVLGAASTSHEASIIMYGSRDANCRGSYDLDEVWKSLISALEMSPDLRNLQEGIGDLEAAPPPGLREKSP